MSLGMRMGMGMGLGFKFKKSLISAALFSLINETTIIPESGTHSLFTSGAGVVKNSDDIYQSLPTNCARFEGVRYVINLVANSHSPATQTILSAKAGEYVFQCENVGNVSISGATDGSYGSIVSGASEIKQLTFTATVDQNITITVTTTPDAFQLEDKTSYVTASQIIGSELINSTSDYGCGVNGVKAFDTALGNTVSSGVITTGTGAALTGLLGQLYEPAATNLFLNSFVPVTQNITTTAQTYTLSVEGTGDITLSGTATGVATDGNPLTVTATAGTLTLTVNGTVTKVNFEASSYSTSFIETFGSAVTRAVIWDKKVWPLNLFNNFYLEFKFTPSDMVAGYIFGSGLSAKTLQWYYDPDRRVRVWKTIGTGNYIIYSNSALLEDTEYLLKVTMDSNGFQMYIDDVLQTDTDINIEPLEHPDPAQIFIGANWAAGGMLKCNIKDLIVDNI